MSIPFNWPYVSGQELEYLREAMAVGHLSGDGPFTKKCQGWLEENTGARKALLTHSCTAALEMAAILAGIMPGDEVIMPSFTFPSTANAFVLRGGVPVFIDIRKDTQNMDESLIEEAITEHTKVIVPVHYAGVSCEMDAIMGVAEKYGLLVIEDAAQSIMASYRRKPSGSIGHMAALSFHDSKNVICGEGGALLINDERFVERAEILREKGTNRSQFRRGQVDKYTWIDVGSSYLMSELTAAFLLGQLEEARAITERRLALWEGYHSSLAILETEGLARLPQVPLHCVHNGHIFYMVFSGIEKRALFITLLKNGGIPALFHYVPLHSSPAGKRYGRTHGHLSLTKETGEGLVRLPLWIGLDEKMSYIIDRVLQTARKLG